MSRPDSDEVLVLVVPDRPGAVAAAIKARDPEITSGLVGLSRRIHQHNSCRVDIFGQTLLSRRTTSRRILVFIPKACRRHR